MPVRVDQARHHEPSAAIDHLRAVGWGQVTGRDQLDTIGLDKEAKPSPQGVGLAVEKQKILKHDWRRGVRRRHSSAARLNETERHE